MSLLFTVGNGRMFSMKWWIGHKCSVVYQKQESLDLWFSEKNMVKFGKRNWQFSDFPYWQVCSFDNQYSHEWKCITFLAEVGCTIIGSKLYWAVSRTAGESSCICQKQKKDVHGKQNSEIWWEKISSSYGSKLPLVFGGSIWIVNNPVFLLM